MAGHSKWANIKHRKAKVDAQRGKIFTKLIREITVAARHGGGDPSSNPTLRLAIDKARIENMKRDTIDNAIARGAGASSADDLQEMRYEGYGPGGVAVMVDCLTNNKNRTAGEVRHAFTKCGGNLGTDGSVSYLFTETGLIMFEPGANEDRVIEVALEAGANDVISRDDGSIEVLTPPDEVMVVKDALEKAGLKPTSAQKIELAANEIAITDLETAEKLVKLQDMLEELDDVQDVHSNADIAPELLDKIN